MTSKKLKFRRVKKIVDRFATILICIYLLTWIFPYYFFNHKIEYKNFKIYSTTKISNNISNILDRTDSLLSASEIYTTNIEHRIFICNNFALYTFFTPLARKAFACNYPIIKNIFIANSNIDKDIAFSNRKKNNKRSLSSVIAHEIMHSLIEKHIGLIKNRMLPTWKAEGYCEFIAQESSINIKTGMEMFKKGQKDSSKTFKYFEYRKVMEYLINEKNLSFDDVLNQNLDFDKVKLDAKSLHNK